MEHIEFEVEKKEKHDISLEEITNKLDEDQLKAVTTELKNTLCRSIAGSGKTTILTRRVAYLLHLGIPEHEILLLTFTNKSAQEMLDRVKVITKRDKTNILGGTFHSVCARFLRKYAKEIGYGRNFSILTPDDARIVVASVRESYLLERGIPKADFPKANVILNIISNSINNNINLEDVDVDFQNSYETYLHLEEIKRLYEERKFESNSMDFDDLLINMNKLLKLDKVLKEIQKQYKYVLVDEYQDVNYLQNNMIDKINGDNDNLFVVGDINQAIYSFRGSDTQFIEMFPMFYGAKVFNIKTNYRSTGNILKLAENSINKNYQEEPVVMKESGDMGTKPIYYKAHNEHYQAEFIASDIANKLKSGISPTEIAIILRGTFMTVKPLETALRKRGINYVLRAGFSYYERKHVKDVLSFLSLTNNPKSEQTFKRILKLFEGIGDKTADNIWNMYKAEKYDIVSFRESLDSGKNKLSKKINEKLEIVMNLIDGVYEEKDIGKKIDFVMSEFYKEYLMKNTEDANIRIEDIYFLIGVAKGYKELDIFLEEVLLEVANSEIPEEENPEEDSIVITTVHRAKGLEWDYVYVTYMNENFFPSTRVINSLDEFEMQEERRLAYVSFTRAKKELKFFSISNMSITRQSQRESRFVSELDSELYDKRYINPK